MADSRFISVPPTAAELKGALTFDNDVLESFKDKPVKELKDFMKSKGVSDDAIELAFIKNFSTPSYNVSENTPIGQLFTQAPKQVRKRGIAQAAPEEQQFFAPQERQQANIPYMPAIAAPVPVIQQGPAESVGLPEAATSAQDLESPERYGVSAKSTVVDAYDARKYGPRPEYSLSQLARPVGFFKGLGEEAGKLGLEAAGRGLQAAGVQDISTSRANAAQKISDISGIPVTPEQMKPKTIEHLKQFAGGVEKSMHGDIVNNAITEGSDIIGGLATMLLRDVVPLLPTKERTVEQQIKAAEESGASMISAPVVMGTFGTEVLNELVRGNFQEAEKMVAAKPVTLALILYPYIKKGYLSVAPEVKAWIERTSGKYYADRAAPTNPEYSYQPEDVEPSVTPKEFINRAKDERSAQASRMFVNPFKQATPEETRAAETGLAEARAKSAAGKEAFEEAVKQKRTPTGLQRIQLLKRASETDTGVPMGITAPEVEALQNVQRTQLSDNVQKTMSADAKNPNVSFDDFQSKLTQNINKELLDKVAPETPRFQELSDELQGDLFKKHPDFIKVAQEIESIKRQQQQALATGTSFYPEERLQSLQDSFQKIQDDVVNQANKQTYVKLLQEELEKKRFQAEGIPNAQAEKASVGAATSTTALRNEPKAALELTPSGENILTREARETKSFIYDPRIKKTRAVSTTETPTGVSMEMQAQQLLEDISSSKPNFRALTPEQISKINNLKQLLNIEDVSPETIMASANELVKQAKLKEKGALVETYMIPDQLVPQVDAIRNRLINRLQQVLVPEGNVDVLLDKSVADQVAASAIDVLSFNRETFLNSPIIRKEMVSKISSELGVSTLEAKNILDNVVESNQGRLRLPKIEIKVGDKSITPEIFDNLLSDSFEKLIEKSPKLAEAISKEIATSANKKVETYLFNQTLKQFAKQKTYSIPETPNGGIEFMNDLTRQDQQNHFIDPVIVFEKGSKHFDSVINELKNSSNNASRELANTLSRYEDPNPSLVEAGIVPANAKVARGFNESFGPVVKGIKQFTTADKILGNYKRSVTSRNLLSAVNNLTSNILMETMYYGDPTTLIDLINPIGEVRTVLKSISEGNVPKKYESIVRAIKASGIVDSSLIDVELGLADESAGIVTKAAGKVSKTLGDLSSKADAIQDRFYKFGDNFFKVNTMLKEMKIAQEAFDIMKEGETIDVLSQLGLPTRLRKTVGGFIIEHGKNAGKVLSEQELNDLTARGAAKIAANKYVDYSRRPLYLNELEQLRAGPLGGPLVTNFLTWKYKMTDAVVPYATTGKNIRAGATSALPAGVTAVHKPGIFSAFGNNIIQSSTSQAVKNQMALARASEMGRRSAVFGAAEIVDDNDDKMLRKGMSYGGNKQVPSTTIIDLNDPRIIYGKNWSQQNFLDPTFTALQAPETLLGLSIDGVDEKYLRGRAKFFDKYLDRRDKGELLSGADILDLAGYGGDTLYEMYKKIDEAQEGGTSKVLRSVGKAILPAIIGGTYAKALQVGSDLLSGPDEQKAGKYPIKNTETAGKMELVMREMIGLGYKEAYLNGSLRSKYPTEVLDKVYKNYNDALYTRFLNQLNKEMTLAKENDASDKELEAIRAKHQMSLDTYKRLVREVADNYKDVVHKSKGSKQ